MKPVWGIDGNFREKNHLLHALHKRTNMLKPTEDSPEMWVIGKIVSTDVVFNLRVIKNKKVAKLLKHTISWRSYIACDLHENRVGFSIKFFIRRAFLHCLSSCHHRLRKIPRKSEIRALKRSQITPLIEFSAKLWKHWRKILHGHRIWLCFHRWVIKNPFKVGILLKTLTREICFNTSFKTNLTLNLFTTLYFFKESFQIIPWRNNTKRYFATLMVV